jgi:hypothetical protein
MAVVLVEGEDKFPSLVNGSHVTSAAWAIRIQIPYAVVTAIVAGLILVLR